MRSEPTIRNILRYKVTIVCDNTDYEKQTQFKKLEMQTYCKIESHTYEIAIMRNTCNNVI